MGHHRREISRENRREPKRRVQRNAPRTRDRVSTPTPVIPRRAHHRSYSPARGRSPTRSRSPRVRRSTHYSKNKESRSDRKSKKPKDTYTSTSSEINLRKEILLARLTVCAAFAKLVTNSSDESVLKLAKRLLRRKINSPLGAFLALSLD